MHHTASQHSPSQQTRTIHQSKNNNDMPVIIYSNQNLPPCYPSSTAVSGSFHGALALLFNFPSQYFFAIGLDAISSLGSTLPPALRCTFKQRDSNPILHNPHTWPYRTITFCGGAFQHTWAIRWASKKGTKAASAFALYAWTLGVSLAVTRPITVVFFSFR